jgi:hypothetical protein
MGEVMRWYPASNVVCIEREGMELHCCVFEQNGCRKHGEDECMLSDIG